MNLKLAPFVSSCIKKEKDAEVLKYAENAQIYISLFTGTAQNQKEAIIKLHKTGGASALQILSTYYNDNHSGLLLKNSL